MRLAREEGGIDAGDPDRRERNGPPGIDELLERLLVQEPPVHDAHRADGDDLVAVGGGEPGGLGVEHGVREVRELPLVELRRLPRLMEQVEVVVLGPAAGRDRERERRLLGLRHRDDQPEEAGRGGPARLVPHRAVVALDDLLQRERKRFTVRLERLVLPSREGLGRDVGAGPGEVEVRAPARRLERDPQLPDALALQPGRDRDDRSHERVAVHLEPDRGIDRVQDGREPEGALDPRARRRDEIGPQHVLEQPLGPERRRIGRGSGRGWPRAPPPPRG